MIIDYSDIYQLGTVAKQLISLASHKKIWLFYGEIGSGKTTLISHILKQMGYNESVSSPTFAIVNEYQINTEKKVYHFDFYRINKLEEVLDIGIDEYLSSNHYCFIEWPEIAEPILMDYEIVKIKLVVDEKGKRFLTIFV